MPKRVAIVTGGTGGLGQTVVRDFLGAGIPVAIPVSTGHRGSPGTEMFPGAHTFIRPADLRDATSVGKFIDSVRQEFGQVDYLVNIAGGYAGGRSIEEITLEEWEGMLDVNLTTAFLMTRGVLAIMKSRGFGRIINIAALPAVLPSANKAAYAVSKRGVVALTELTHEEVKGKGITVNAIAPGIIDTEANRKAMGEKDVARWVTPSEISRLIQYLCSDDARPVSGNVIRAFGGL
jgi:NAD(P)-dependent dehydrogenase (short-subunit alcohol dehydrogenase family)